MYDIYKKLVEFKSNLGQETPRLYFCKVDVKSCFDFIDQGKLLDLLQSILSQVFCIQSKNNKIVGRIYRSKVFKCVFLFWNSQEMF